MKNSEPPIEIGSGTIYPAEKILSDKDCAGCKQRSRCLAGEGIPIIVRNFQHLYIPDYKESWTLFVDLPDCKQLNSVFSEAQVSASLFTGIRNKIKGKIIESRISQMAELNVVEI